MASVTDFRSTEASVAAAELEAILAPHSAGDASGRSLRLLENDLRQISQCLSRMGNAKWSKVPRLYSVLTVVGETQVIDSFINQGVSDLWFPFSHQTLPQTLRSRSARFKFIESQDRVLTKALDLEREDGKHRHFSNPDEIPLRKVAELGREASGRNFKKNVEVLRDFERELGNLKKLSHIHIVELVGSYTDPKFVGILMAPVADYNLKDFLERKTLTTGELSFLRTFYGCLANALCYLHDQQVRHKDIKPQNVLVKGHQVFLTDFGISLDWSDLGQSTTTGVTIKTPRYCAPEVARSLPRNTLADLWSLGCVFVEIWTVLTGKTPSQLFAYLGEQGSKSTCYYLNCESVFAWCDHLQGSAHSTAEHPPLAWIRGTLQSDQDRRWTSRTLVESITEVNDNPDVRFAFSGTCCIYDDSTTSDASSSYAKALDETGASSIEVYHPRPPHFDLLKTFSGVVSDKTLPLATPPLLGSMHGSITLASRPDSDGQMNLRAGASHERYDQRDRGTPTARLIIDERSRTWTWNNTPPLSSPATSSRTIEAHQLLARMEPPVPSSLMSSSSIREPGVFALSGSASERRNVSQGFANVQSTDLAVFEGCSKELPVPSSLPTVTDSQIATAPHHEIAAQKSSNIVGTPISVAAFSAPARLMADKSEREGRVIAAIAQATPQRWPSQLSEKSAAAEIQTTEGLDSGEFGYLSSEPQTYRIRMTPRKDTTDEAKTWGTMGEVKTKNTIGEVKTIGVSLETSPSRFPVLSNPLVNGTDLRITIITATNLHKRDVLSSPDPVAVLTVNGEQTKRTSVVQKTLRPYWNEGFTVRVMQDSVLRIQVFDQKKYKKKTQGFLGAVSVCVGDVFGLDSGKETPAVEDLKNSYQNQMVPYTVSGQLLFSMRCLK